MQRSIIVWIKRRFRSIGRYPNLLEDSIIEEPPLAIKEGGIIKEGFKEDIDKLKRAKTEGKQWLMELEEREREKTGIKNLKIKFKKVFGYYLDVTNSYKDLVPDHYIRKQTLANSERYTTEELNQLADTIPIFAFAAGTKEPICAINTIRATCLI